RLGQGSADRLRRDRKRASLYRTEAPEAARSLVARRARRRHARPARHPYQRRLGRLLAQARPKQLARKSKPPLPITKIRSMIASLWIAPARDVLYGAGEKDAIGFVRQVAEMRRGDDVRKRAERMVGGQGLSREDVESGAIEPPAAGRVDQRGLVDQRAARVVDQDRVLLHQADFARTDDAGGFPRQWQVR